MVKSNRKIRAAMIIGICVSIVSLIVLAIVVLQPFFSADGRKSQSPETVREKKYVSEYILACGENRNLIDRWNIAKMKKEDGTEYLRIVRIQDLEDPIDYLHFEVFDSSSEAENAYRKLYEQYKGYDSGFVSCDGYFKSYDPYVDDAVVYEMVYLKDNIIIFAELSVESCYVEMESTTAPGETEKREPPDVKYDRARLEKYIIDNSDMIKEIVLEHLLKY